MTSLTPSLRGRRDERGQSVSLYVLTVTAALILTTGLVVDGGQKIAASSRAESAAAGAARAAANAAATQALAGRDSAGAGVLAAKAFLAGQPDVSGSVSVKGGVVSVRTRSTTSTIFLSALGIDEVAADGSAEANIAATGQTR